MRKSFITALIVTFTVILAASCSTCDQTYSRQHGIDAKPCTFRETALCYKAATSYIPSVIGDSTKYVVMANSTLGDRSSVDTASSDTVRYRVMWFKIRIDSAGITPSILEFPLYFTPDLELWTHSEQDIADILQCSRK